MSFQRFIKPNQTLPWCKGCGIFSIFYTTCEILDELDLTNTVIVSGIGCTGRSATYFNLDTIHGLHGRAIPLAVGIKQGNPKLNVVIISGDGDLLSIGGNHLLHSARRNDNITVICNLNEVFAMTGGQLSPSTRLGGVTTTTPKGNTIQPINTQGIILSNEKYFFARSSPIQKNHLKKCIKEAMQHKGFSFVEIISPCIVNYKNKNGESFSEIFEEIRQNFKICKENRPLGKNEFGIVKND